MRSRNLLPGFQYYNYFISGSLIMLLFTGEQRRLRLYFYVFLSSFFFLSFRPSFRPRYATALPRNDSAFHKKKKVRFVGERILGIRMTNRAFVHKVRSINRAVCSERKVVL